MRIYEHFPYTGRADHWVVPEGVTSALFECWGAAGGMPSSLAFEGKKREVRGGTGPRNIFFYNAPGSGAQGQLGRSYANNAGYARGVRAVTAGQSFKVYVGGNGHPGHSTIKLHKDGTSYSIGLRGGTGGWNGGGNGGEGAHVTQNLYDSTSTRVHYKRATMPNAAKVGQKWYDTSAHLVKQCNTTYTAGNGTAAKWDTVTHVHDHAVGPSGGGGGGATDIRLNGHDISNRILVAGGGGGAGGNWNKTGAAAWTLRPVPAQPAPPYGSDSTASGATGPDKTWLTSINYLVGGWGRGGLGGGTGPSPHGLTTTDGGIATAGGGGGPSTARHQDGSAPGHVHGSGGNGGSNVAGGKKGHGGSGGQDGSKGQGGNGASADGGYDDWCAGGGGGGGGYYGGGGGGQGFKVSGHNSGIHTRGGGGGGGSNYADPSFTHVFLGGTARPPFAKGNSGTGANGHGGFARISYNLPPKVKWKSIPRSALGGTNFDATFRFSPAQDGGSAIAYYTIGTSTTASDTAPTSETTVMVTDTSVTEFTHSFTAPPAGSTYAYFVRVTDKDGDSSDWLKQKVTGLAATETTGATITLPAAGAQFVDTATVDWTVGTQTPLAAFRLGLTGNTLDSSHKATPLVGGTETGWRRGGSRVNLALDPGFVGSAVWSSGFNTALAPDTTHPGVSGSNGIISWALADDGSAENHTTPFDTLVPGTTYRLSLGVSSSLANDPRPVAIQVWDDDGLLAEERADLSATAAGTYVEVDVEFTPHTQNAYAVILPSGSVADTDPLSSSDFEDGTIGSWAALNSHTLAVDGTNAYQGDYALYILNGTGVANQAAQLDVTASLTGGAGWYFAQTHAYVTSASDHSAVLRVSAPGSGSIFVTDSTRDADTLIRLPFYWDGTGSVLVQVDGATSVGEFWYDLIEVYAADTTGVTDGFGNADSGQVHYLSDMMVELKYEEDSGGYGAYFDGGHLNGLTGTVSWQGTANASPSFLTGTDIVTSTLDYTGDPLDQGELFLDTLTEAAIVDGFDGARATVAVRVNPSTPATPTVSMTVDSTTGLVTLLLDAADGAASNKTVTLDVFRDGVRIAAGLVPDLTTRQVTFYDAPVSGATATYVVRAWDSASGYTDQADGTVTVVN